MVGNWGTTNQPRRYMSNVPPENDRKGRRKRNYERQEKEDHTPPDATTAHTWVSQEKGKPTQDFTQNHITAQITNSKTMEFKEGRTVNTGAKEWRTKLKNTDSGYEAIRWRLRGVAWNGTKQNLPEKEEDTDEEEGSDKREDGYGCDDEAPRK